MKHEKTKFNLKIYNNIKKPYLTVIHNEILFFVLLLFGIGKRSFGLYFLSFKDVTKLNISKFAI